MPAKVGKYEIGKTIGEGTFGKVRFARNVDTGERVAMKILDKAAIGEQMMMTQIKREVQVMKGLSHTNVVALYEVMSSKKKIFIALELVMGGELYDAIRAAGKLEEPQARDYFNQLAAGVAYCHSVGVSHRDLKPENILLAEDGTLKISDFGLANFMYGTEAEERQSGARLQMLSTTCGTPNYVAPEILTGGTGYDGSMADTWSCGVILFVMLNGKLPFDEPRMSVLFRKITTAEFEVPAHITVAASHLIRAMLKVNPAERLSLAAVRKHPWCRGDEEEEAIVDADAGANAGADVGAAAEAGATLAGAPAAAPAEAAPATRGTPPPPSPKPTPMLAPTFASAVAAIPDADVEGAVTMVESPRQGISADVTPTRESSNEGTSAPPTLSLPAAGFDADVAMAAELNARLMAIAHGGASPSAVASPSFMMPPPGFSPPATAGATQAQMAHSRRRKSTGGVAGLAGKLGSGLSGVVAAMRSRRSSWTAGEQRGQDGASPASSRVGSRAGSRASSRRPSIAQVLHPPEKPEKPRSRRPSRSAPPAPPGHTG
jgi:tRNA A-37 threonylcarbamoyl transferase component Bud32